MPRQPAASRRDVSEQGAGSICTTYACYEMFAPCGIYRKFTCTTTSGSPHWVGVWAAAGPAWALPSIVQHFFGASEKRREREPRDPDAPRYVKGLR